MTVKVMTWYNEDGGIVRDKTPLGALNARKTNNANTAGPVSLRAISVAIEKSGSGSMISLLISFVNNNI